MVSDPKWNSDVASKIANDLRLSADELEILVFDLKEWRDRAVRNQRIIDDMKKIVSPESELGKILRGD